MNKSTLFNGGKVTDERGSVSFVNSFHFKHVKRFYQLENSPTHSIRAFHGHMKEAKYFYVASGSIFLCLVPLDDPKNPTKNAQVETFTLSSNNPQIVYVPPGFANGFKSLEKNTTIIVFSTATLEKSQNDDFRYPYDYWGKEIWNL